MDLVDLNASRESAVQALEFCINNGHEDATDALLKTHFRDKNLSDTREQYMNLLSKAVNSGSCAILSQLLVYTDDEFLLDKRQAEKNVATKLLCRAVENGNAEMVRILIQKQGEVNVHSHGAPLLHRSIHKGNLKLAQALVDAGADLNAKDNKGQCILMAAITSKEIKVLEWLLSLGVDPKKKLSNGKEAIHIAAAHSRNAVLRLVDAGCDVNSKDLIGGDTPMHVACWRACGETIESLVRSGANMNVLNNQGETPLGKLLKFATDIHNFHSQSRIKLARVLVKVGFRIVPRDQMTCESNVRTRRKGRDKVADLYTQIVKKSNNICSLQMLCSLVIRNAMHGERLNRSLQKLEIPHHLKDFIMFKDFKIDSSYSVVS